MNILVPNLGSTSLKYKLLEMPSEMVLTRGRLERITNYHEAIRRIDTAGKPIEAVAFKTVLGGKNCRGTYVIDESVISALEEYLPVAPAHNAIYLTGIQVFREAFPKAYLVAAFENEFHATMPEYAANYGVPPDWREENGIRRFGFHGASHQYVSQRVPQLIGASQNPLRLASCHLGGSSSICAIVGGRSIDTTMGFSPQSGLENATRHGDLDVFAVLYMMERHGWNAGEVTKQLSRSGGLAGLSGINGGDVRDIETAASAGNEDAALALKVFAYQIRKTIGAYAAAMSGLDIICFTGGIGENAAGLRTSCCAGLEFLGVKLDPERNRNCTGDRIISADDSGIKVVVLTTNEELIVARRAYCCLTASLSSPAAGSSNCSLR